MPVEKCRILAAIVLLIITGMPGGRTAARTLWVDVAAGHLQPDGSSQRPFARIGDALKVAEAGDVIELRSGTYREALRLSGGKPGKPITLKAAEGHRVIISGCMPISGWRPAGDGLWVTELDWKPDQLLLHAKPLPIARVPAEGWWRSQRVERDRLFDPENLCNASLAPTGGRAYVWLSRGNVYRHYPIKLLDTETGTLTLDGVKPGEISSGDKYWLENRRQFIQRPGHWAVEPAGARFRVYLRPRSPEDLQYVEAPRQERSLVTIRNASHLRLEGLEIMGGRRMGIELHATTDVHVRRCIVYANGYIGISLRDTNHCTVAQCISWANQYGISVSHSRNAIIEQNDVGYNAVDGLLVTWDSHDIVVQNNYLHHHLLWGHPDNFQIYRNVTGLVFKDNLLLAGGQSIMAEETRDGVISGNMIVGSAAYMLILGHGNAGHYRIERNTLAMAGYGCMSLTWEDYRVYENVITNGHSKALYGVRGIAGYEGDRNLLWNSPRAQNPQVMATDSGWHRTLDAARASTGQDTRSVYADPQFRCGPIALSVLDHSRLQQSTRHRWFLRGGTSLFRQGDWVEVNFDGVRRKVVAVDQNSITVQRPLREKPLKGWLVANWGQRADGAIDLRLSTTSPGAKLAEDGGPVGSQIDIEAYQRGDFDGDGRRDLPPVPAELKYLLEPY